VPAVIQCDNGTEFTSVALDHCCCRNQASLEFSRPGKPTDNPAIESFHNSFRRECLTQHYSIDLTEAQQTIERYRSEYSNDRPHSASATCHRPTSGPWWRPPPASPVPHNVSPSGPTLGARPQPTPFPRGKPDQEQGYGAR
jgi:transposase InsO family protein